MQVSHGKQLNQLMRCYLVKYYHLFIYYLFIYHIITYDTFYLVCNEALTNDAESRPLHYTVEKGASCASVRLSKASQ